MNQNEFLHILHNELLHLNETERLDILHDFKEHFTNGLADGKTEAEISHALGNPKQIARDIAPPAHHASTTHAQKQHNVFGSTWIAIGLIAFNLIFILGPFIGIVGVIFGGWVSGGAFIISPILAGIKYMFLPNSFVLFEFFLSIALSGLGILLLIGMYYVSKYTYKGLMLYVRFNVNLVTGGTK